MRREAILLGLVLLGACGYARERRSLQHGGREREFLLHRPSKPASPAPLLIVLHGGGGDMKGMKRLTRFAFEKLAEPEGWLVAYPDGTDGHWNDGRENERIAARENVDDVGFIASVIDAIDAEVPVDRARVYVTGASNGGMMSNRLAIELSDRIAAAAPVIAQIPAPIASRSRPTRPVPVLIINGTQDTLIPWEGGEPTVLGKKLGRILSTEETVAYWTSQNGCTGRPTVEWLPDRVPDDGTRVCRESYAGAAPVVLYRIEGGGHTWPGGVQYLPEMFIGRTSRDLDATAAIFSFFKEQRLR